MKDLSIQAYYSIFYNGMYMLLKNRILLTVVIGTVLELSVFHIILGFQRRQKKKMLTHKL